MGGVLGLGVVEVEVGVAEAEVGVASWGPSVLTGGIIHAAEPLFTELPLGLSAGSQTSWGRRKGFQQIVTRSIICPRPEPHTVFPQRTFSSEEKCQLREKCIHGCNLK